MPIIRWNPFFDGGLLDVEAHYESTANELLADSLPVDMYEKNGMIVIEAQLPGVAPEQVTIEITENMVRISGFRQETDEGRSADYIKEIKRGKFHRTLVLSSKIAVAQAVATMQEGLLQVSLPLQKIESVNLVTLKIGS
ncbi:MAG TPA: Hsp20/alpha crystallin family protein [Candidatus Babeliales bacterium]|nr:Hsp20/alpha crystallin family protein [Candidatus Babeliales bacterium]